MEFLSFSFVVLCLLRLVSAQSVTDPTEGRSFTLIARYASVGSVYVVQCFSFNIC